MLTTRSLHSSPSCLVGTGLRHFKKSTTNYRPLPSDMRITTFDPTETTRRTLLKRSTPNPQNAPGSKPNTAKCGAQLNWRTISRFWALPLHWWLSGAEATANSGHCSSAPVSSGGTRSSTCAISCSATAVRLLNPGICPAPLFVSCSFSTQSSKNPALPEQKSLS